jgi:electron transfer flavoprotein alpha subunit
VALLRVASAATAPTRGGETLAAPAHLPLTDDLNSALPAALPVERRESGQQAANLEGARVVVSGGRGTGGEAGFASLSDLAACLGGALGGSLPTVDAGWVPVSRQVGQSGKFVAPDLYVAVGISGTPQHMAGIAAHTRILAINKEADANIFRFAEIGIVGDWRDVLPALIERLRAGEDTSRPSQQLP